jgi:hypothetical protein
MTDGNESYRLRWEGSLNEGKGVVLIASDSRMVNEDIQKMKHLMGYKSEETLGNLKASERLNENESFNDVWKKTKTILTEGIDELTQGQEFIAKQAGNPKKIEKVDFDELNARKNESEMPNLGGEMAQIEAGYNAAMGSQGTEGSLYEMEQDEAPRDEDPRDVKRVEDLFSKITSIQAALSRIDNRVEIIKAIEGFLTTLLTKHPELAPQVKNPLIQTVKDTVDNTIDASQGQQQDVTEGDRFDEVFGGMDEE